MIISVILLCLIALQIGLGFVGFLIDVCKFKAGLCGSISCLLSFNVNY